MAVSGLTSPVVVDGRVSDEKLNELLGLQAEYPELDYKRQIDLSSAAGVVELAKDVGAMQVRGGYIVAGVDGSGVPTGDMDGIDARPFDEANLVPKLRQYLPVPLELRSRVMERDGHDVVLIYVGRHPSGCAIFHTDGQHGGKGKPEIVFRAGDVFWRDGTRSVPRSLAICGQQRPVDRLGCVDEHGLRAAGVSAEHLERSFFVDCVALHQDPL